MSKFVKLSFVLSFILGMSAIAFGQSTVAGAIGGVVTNPNKEVVPNAAVTVRNTETNKEDTATTDDQGRFKVSGLQPGTYAITINGSGFSPYTQEATVEVGRETTINAALSIGPVSGGTIEVTADAPVINTSQQDFSSNINQTSISELPINGRRWSNFALLTPGAVPDGTFGLISFRGISGLLNNNTIDGGDNNQAFFAEERGRTRISYSISQSAIREFQVNTSSYSAEYGRSAGGVVNAVTKSGTNEFHGDAFYFQRNNKWGARNPRSFITQNVSGVFTPVAFKPVDVRHQFGGTIGGPIAKDKAFFFFSYDEQRRNFPGVSTYSALDFLNRADRCLLTAPLGQARSLAQCPAYPGTTGTINRNASLGTGKGLTDTQVDNALNFLNSIAGEVPRTGNQRLFLPKVDWNLNDKNTFTATYNRLRWKSPAGIQTQAINFRAKDNFGDDGVNIDSLNLRLASTITNSLINEFRFQWGRDNEFQLSQPPLPGEPTNSLGGRSPQTFITNGFSFGIPEFLERPAFPDERRHQFADTVTLTVGNHTFKFGGDVNLVKDIISNLRFSGGEFNYTGGVNSPGFYAGLNDFILDYTNFLSPLAQPASGGRCYSSTRATGKCYGGNFNQGLGVLGLTMKTTDLNYFLQDDWRVSPRLTLNLGVRYEYQRNPLAINPNPLLPQTRNNVNDRNNIGPRIGFAYDINGDGKTSLRGGWGIYYGRVINSTVYNALVNTGVGIDVAQRQVTLQATSAAAPSYPNLLTAGALVAPAVQYFSPKFQLPQIHQWDFIFEREIARNTVVSASYLGSFGNSLPNFVDINLNPPSATGTFTAVGGPFDGQKWTLPLFLGARPIAGFGQITEIRSDVFSKYHALVLQANRRLTNGLQFQSSYTLSRAYDNGQTSATFTLGNAPFNAFDQSGESALSAFDRRQKFVASVVYNTNFKGGSSASRAILNGWTFAPIFNAFSGQRFTPTVSGTMSPGGSGAAATLGAGSNFGLTPGLATPGGGVNGSGGSTRFALLPRNFYKQPNIWYLDMRISRRFSLTEKMKLELLAEGFNLFNRTQVTGVSAGIYSICSTGTLANPCPLLNFSSGPTGFNSVTGADSTLFRERQVQLAARFQF
ncbi:MAG TPA: TonB-dependent receptor [Pyrinomonadaceae bacterium]|nr:TonB-dependent receptor [Pyrinomonadaceae bacterium]